MPWWKALLWSLLFMLVTQLVPALVVTLSIHVANPGLNDHAPGMGSPIEDLPGFFLAVVIASTLAGIAFSLVILRWSLGKDWRRLVSLRLPKWDHVALAVVAMPALLVLFTAIEAVLRQWVPEIPGLDSSLSKELNASKTWPWWLAVLCIGFLPAISEELWCRGFLGRGLVGRYGYGAGIVLTSLIFGAMHLVPRQGISAALVGLVLHYSYLATRSLLIPVLIHFFYNSLAVLNDSQTGSLPLISSLEDTYDRVGFLFLLSAGLVLAVVGLAMHQSRFRRVSLDGRPMVDSLETPLKGTDEVLIREPIPPGTIILIVMALGAFAAIWWNM